LAQEMRSSRQMLNRLQAARRGGRFGWRLPRGAAPPRLTSYHTGKCAAGARTRPS
jgi:hypothetical protein